MYEYNPAMKMMRKMMAWMFGKKIMGMRMISCRDVSQILQDYIEDELPDSERRSIDMHLALCKECRVFLSTYKETVHLVGRIPDTPMPKEFSDHLVVLLRKRWAH